MSQASSDTSEDVDDVSPPWGSLPVEKFLLWNWDTESSENADEQRKRLVREYVKAGFQRAVGQIEDPLRINDPHGKQSLDITQSVEEMHLSQHPQAETSTLPPTPTQIASILRPWRTVEQRDLAVDPGLVGSIWLRTCYKEGTDSQHEVLVADIDMEMAVDGDERLLNDPTLYDFGDSWERVLDYIPELICNRDKNASSRSESLRNAVDTFRKAQVILSDSSATAEIDGPRMGLIADARRHLPAADVQGYVLKILQSDIHEASVVNYVIVEDEEALVTSLVLLLFLDARGHVVRRYRLSASEAEQVGGGWLELCWDDSYYWVEAEVGEDYREDGVCGNLLYFKPGR